MNSATPISQINDLIRLKNDKSKQLKTLDYKDSGLLPIVDQGSSLICGYTNDISKKYDKGLPVIVFGDHTLHTKYVDFDFAIGADGTQIIVPINKNDNVRYLYYLILRATELIGSEGYKRHLKILKDFFTPYNHNPSEQQKIASILTSVDEVIEKTESQISKLSDLKKGMMQELLTKGIGHTEFKDSPVGRIPKEWEVKKLSDILLTHRGGAPLKPTDFSTGGFRVIPKKAVQKGGRLVIDNETFCTNDFAVSHKRSCVDKSYLITTLRDLVPTGPNIGLIVKIQDGNKYLLAQGVYGFQLEGKIDHDFICHLSNTDWYRRVMRKIFVGSTQIHIRTGEFFDIDIPVPTFEEQCAISAVLNSMHKKIYLLDGKKRQFMNLKNSLMQNLLTGKVRVNMSRVNET